MENESPNLFDSESLSVKLTVADNPDDILDEILEEIREDAKPLSNAENIEKMERTDEENVIAYHTDESGEEEVTDDLNQTTDGDKSVDQSTEQQTEDSPITKTKDVHKGLPPGRVKLIMKMDPDVNIIAGDAVFLVTKATESFVGLLAQHCHKAMVASNKKTLQKKHIDAVIEENVPFEFLEGALDW